MKRFTVLIAAIVFLVVSGHASAGILTVKGQTYTNYPIVLVPGVFSWDNIMGMDINYFYKVEEALEESAYSIGLTSGIKYQQTYFIPLNPWQGTEERAADLKRQLDTLMAKYNYKKVNIIAHSHGATTSRLAIRWMVQEAKASKKTNPIASFTSIAGPHFGTPVADYYMGLNETGQVVLSGLLDLSGDFISIVSGLFGFVGDSDSDAVFHDFSQPVITKFNADYPSAGLPKGAGAYGEGGAAEGAYAGDGLGNAMSTTNAEAILYYSWTGNIGNGWGTAMDPADLVMYTTNFMNLSYGYEGDADGFIPVSSARFGKVINNNYYWNHVDEINQFMGIVNASAADPVSVFRAHANRLQKASR
jgi:triacylglycerol lipase